MSNRATPSRSFNTVKHSNREQRRKRKMQERRVLLSMFLVVIAILLTLLVFLICSVADLIGNNTKTPNTPDDPIGTNNPQPTGITYTQITKISSDIHLGELVIVNDDHYFDPSTAIDLKNIYDNRLKYNDIYNTYQVPNTEWKLNATAINAFNQMMHKYYELEEDGSTKISSAYRSYDDQANSTTSTTLPGHSDHHTGYCLALRTSAGGYLEDDHWIYQNCHKYGYIVRYPDEKSDKTGVSGYEYCFRYVGIAHATYIAENGYCLEEYIELLKSNYTSNHLKINGADGNNYEVYYVPAANSDISIISVPSNYQYTISGDNIEGFIITVNLSSPNE